MPNNTPNIKRLLSEQYPLIDIDRTEMTFANKYIRLTFALKTHAHIETDFCTDLKEKYAKGLLEREIHLKASRLNKIHLEGAKQAAELGKEIIRQFYQQRQQIEKVATQMGISLLRTPRTHNTQN